MSGEEKRRSDRVIPMVSDEEMVVLDLGQDRLLAKLMDLSGSGAMVYLLSDGKALTQGAVCHLSLYHQGNVFSLSAEAARISGRLVAFAFVPSEVHKSDDLQAKLIRMEVEWTRLRGLI